MVNLILYDIIFKKLSQLQIFIKKKYFIFIAIIYNTNHLY